MRRFPIIVIAALVVAALFAFDPAPRRAIAQGTWTHTFDFQAGRQGFVLTPPDHDFPAVNFGEWISGAGWTSETKHPGSPAGCDQTRLGAVLELPETVNITDIELTYTGDSAGNSGGSKFGFLSSLDSYGGGLISTGDPFTEGSHTIEAHAVDYDVDRLYLGGYINYSGCAIPDAFIAFQTLVISGTGDEDPIPTGSDGPFRPISGYDTVDINADHTLVETRPNANAHVIAAGTLIQVNPIVGRFNVVIQPAGATTSDQLWYYNDLQSVNGKVGDALVAGCVIGLVAQGGSGMIDPSSGIFLLGADEATLIDWPDYADDPLNMPCDADKYTTENCINLNPNFADFAKNWSVIGGTADPYGITLPPDSSAQQVVALDPEGSYVVTLYATAPYVPAETDLSIEVGAANLTVTVPKSATGEYFRVETQTFSPGAEDFDPDKYVFEIHNGPDPASVITPPIKVRFACIGGDAPLAAPGACYWNGASIAGLQTDSWEHDGGVTYSPPAGIAEGGVYHVPATESVWRDVDISAFVDSDLDFRLTTHSRPTSLLSTSGRWHAWIRDADDDSVLLDIGTWDLIPVVVTIHHSDFTVDAGEHVVGELVIQNVSDDIDDPGWDQNINLICLSVEGGVWPGYDNVDTHDLFSADCTVCAQPSALEEFTAENLLAYVVDWLQFGWCYLGYILRCLILSLLNQVWQTIISIMTGFALFGKWVGMVVSAVATWARDGFRFYFNGFLAGLITIANMLLAWLLSLPLVQGALDALGIALIWIDGIFQLITNTINLIILGFQFIGAILNLIGVAWSAFLTGLSAAPANAFPFPDCTNPATLFYDACIPFDITNFLMTEIPFLIILIDVAAFSVFWRQIRKIIRMAGEELFTS